MKKYFILGALLLVAHVAFPRQLQDSLSVDNCRKAFQKQVEAFPQEKIFIHTDRSTYMAGDTLWFKVYVTDATVHYPSEQSRFAYIELIKPTGDLWKRLKVKLGKGESNGQYEIPIDLPEGNYHLRAYTGTLYGLSSDYFFKKDLHIVAAPASTETKNASPSKKRSNPEKEIRGRHEQGEFDVSFFPEGGYLIAGANCRIGMKALNPTGLSEQVTGYVSDNAGNIILNKIGTTYKGMGSFNLIPSAGATYYATLTNARGDTCRFTLPEVSDKALSLSACWIKDRLHVSVNGLNNGNTRPLYLLIHSSGITQYVGKWDVRKPYLTFNRSDFPSGTLQLLLLDADCNPLSARMLFCNNYDQAHVTLSTRKEEHNEYDRVSLNLSLTDNNRKPLQGNFSISVTNNKYTAVDTSSNILTYLLLTSDLKGYIEEPACYFRPNDSKAAFALDNLMLTQGWTRYNIPQVLKGNIHESEGFVELGQEISGRVKRTFQKEAIPNAHVRIMSFDTMYADETVADENGHFAFRNLSFPDSTRFVLQAYKPNGSQRVALLVDNDAFPPLDKAEQPVYSIPPSKDSIPEMKNVYYNNMRTIQLDEVIVTAHKIDPHLSAFSLVADAGYSAAQIKEADASSIYDILRRIAGVQVLDKHVVIRGQRNITSGAWQYAAVAIDGVIMDNVDETNDLLNYFDLDQINVQDVERIDIFKTNTILWGSRGDFGVVSITMKQGGSGHSTPLIRPNTATIIPLGYIRPHEFYVPKYRTDEDFHTLSRYQPTVFWAPNVDSNRQGKASVDFILPDKQAGYTILIQGISDKGTIINEAIQQYPASNE